MTPPVGQPQAVAGLQRDHTPRHVLHGQDQVEVWCQLTLGPAELEFPVAEDEIFPANVRLGGSLGLQGENLVASRPQTDLEQKYSIIGLSDKMASDVPCL